MIECPSCKEQTSAGLGECQYCGGELPEVKPERQITHSTVASDLEIISTPQTKMFDDELIAIGDVTYAVHTSRTPGKPKTMRVMYWPEGQGAGALFARPAASEFICLDHPAGSFPKRKAADWWRLRSFDPVPACVEDAVSKADAGALAGAKSIVLRKWADKQWPEIFKVEVMDKPLVEHDINEPEVLLVPTPESDDLPF
jgi:hypothetical protein